MSASQPAPALDVMGDIGLHGRTALVTGAGSGIGVETARALAVAGTLSLKYLDRATALSTLQGRPSDSRRSQ